MHVASHPLVELARTAIRRFAVDGVTIEPPTDSLPKRQAGVFVTLHKADGSLRGCIGTISATTPSLAQEVIRNAIASANHDPRFAPVRASECDGLNIHVDILSPLVAVADETELDPRRYGVVVDGGGRRGLLLPDIEEVDTVEMQLSVALQKAGIGTKEPYQLFRFEVERLR